jgi:hypothetical protein
MIEIVIMPRLGTGTNASLLTAAAPRTASSRQPTALPARGFFLPGVAGRCKQRIHSNQRQEPRECLHRLLPLGSYC